MLYTVVTLVLAVHLVMILTLGADHVSLGSVCPCSHLNINDKLHYSDLDVPEGVDLAVKDLREPILKIMRK